jgi:hypothetical protein
MFTAVTSVSRIRYPLADWKLRFQARKKENSVLVDISEILCFCGHIFAEFLKENEISSPCVHILFLLKGLAFVTDNVIIGY